MCPGEHVPPSDTGRRRFLSGTIAVIQGAIGATPRSCSAARSCRRRSARKPSRWWPAALDDLPDNEPTPIAIRVTREDGYSQVVERQIVFS